MDSQVPPAPPPRADGAFALDQISRGLFACGVVALAISLMGLAARYLDFDSVTTVAERLFSADHDFSPRNEQRLGRLLTDAGTLGALGGLTLMALAFRRWRQRVTRAVEWDALAAYGLQRPSPLRVLAASSLAGLALVALWKLEQFGIRVPRLFDKEGPLEDLTSVLALLSAAACITAAVRWKIRNGPHAPLAAGAFALCGTALFFFGMEEISWGQTLFGFDTPGAWSAINYQHETTLHNLADQELLTSTWKLVAILFGGGVLSLTVLAAVNPRTPLAVVAPAPATLPLALIASYAGVRLHPEMIEVLLAIYFAFYAWRLHVAARSLRTEGAGPARRGLTLGQLVKIVVAFALVGLLLSAFDWRQAAQDLGRVSAATVGAVAALMIFGLLLSAWKWSCALRLHLLDYPFGYLLRALCIGFFFNNFLPTAVGGDVYRIYRTLPREGYRSRAFSAVLIERALGLLALLALGAIGAAILAPHSALANMYFSTLLVAVAVGITAVVALERGWLGRVVQRWRHVAAIDMALHNLGLLRNRAGDWLALLTGSFAFQMTSIGIVYTLFAAVSNEVTLAHCALITAIVGLAAALPVSINGIGVMEGAFVAAAVGLGLDYDQALVVALLRRLIGALLSLACGALLLFERRRGAGYEGLDAALRAYRAAYAEAASVPHASAEPRSTSPAPPDVRPLALDLLDSTQDAIILWEMEGQGILYWNRGAERLYGYTREEALGRRTHDLLATRVAGTVNLLETQLARYGVWIGELRHTTRDGREVHVEARLAVMSQHHGRWLVLEVNRDLTDRKRAEGAHEAYELQVGQLRRARHPGS